jgi:hypothetical protein
MLLASFGPYRPMPKAGKADVDAPNTPATAPPPPHPWPWWPRSSTSTSAGRPDGEVGTARPPHRWAYDNPRSYRRVTV